MVVQAADVAQVGLFEFQALLRDRRIPQHYDSADLDQDMLALRELPPPVIGSYLFRDVRK